MSESLAVVLCDVGVFGEQPVGGQQQVIEVKSVGAPKLSVIGLPHLSGRLGGAGNVRVRLAGEPLLSAEHLVLGGRDRGVDRPRPTRLIAVLAGGRAEEPFDDAAAVGGVVDGEGGGVAERLAVAAEDASARSVERHEPEPAPGIAGQGAGTRSHLLGGLVGEGDGEDPVGLDASGGQQPRDSVSQHPRLARPGAGEDQQRPARVLDRFALGRVHPGEKL